MYKYVDHQFGPGETIMAVIKKINHQAMTELTAQKILDEYNRVNDGVVPHPGTKVKIPVLFLFEGMSPETSIK